MSSLYTISPDGASITCNVCGLESHHPVDVREKFCSRCKTFHEDPDQFTELELRALIRGRLRSELNDQTLL